MNRQSRITQKTVRAKADYLARLLGIRADVTTNATERATVTIFLTDSGGAPEPDTSLGVVVTDRLPSGDAAARDFNVAFARVAAALFVPERARTNASRREIEDVFAGETFTMIAVNDVKRLLPHTGFEPAVIATYETACREGWAPVPTNDVQRAIWAKTLDEKERGPTNPIRIEPPNKKKK